AKNKTHNQEKVLIIDAALIYEAKIDRLMDKIIAVYISPEKTFIIFPFFNNRSAFSSPRATLIISARLIIITPFSYFVFRISLKTYTLFAIKYSEY
ncbi:unnamed protein product, partial [marine sediment metagenome]